MKRVIVLSIVICVIVNLYSQEICLTSTEKEVVNLINQKRLDKGLEKVNISPVLMLAANKNAEEMYLQTYSNHEPQAFGDYESTYEYIKITSTLSEAVDIVNFLTTPDLNTNYSEIVLQTGEYSSSIWQGTGICIRDSILVIMFGEKPEFPDDYDICESEYFYNNGEELSNPLLCVSVSETAQLCVYSVKADGSSSLLDYLFVREDGVEMELSDEEAESFAVYIYTKVLPIVPRAMIKFSIDKSDRRRIVANYTFSGNSIEEIQDFINSGKGIDYVDPNGPNGYTMLFRAIMQDNIEAVDFLLKNGADINYESYDKDIALDFVTSNEMFELLITKNPKFEIKSIDNTTVLHSYAIIGLIEPIRYIVENKKIDINTKDRSGGTALMYAVDHDQYETAKFLLENGALQTYGWEVYPLHDAVDNANLEMVKLLVEHGADVNCKNGEGNSPLQLAKNYPDGKSEIIDYLIEMGGR